MRSAEAIGAIVACPKCGSMVQIAPPEGWSPDSAGPALDKAGAEPSGQSPGEDGSAPDKAGEAGVPSGQVRPREQKARSAAADGRLAATADGEVPEDNPAAAPADKPPTPRKKQRRERDPVPKAAAAGLAAGAVPPAPATASSATPAPPVPSESHGLAVPEPPPVSGQVAAQIPRFASPAELLWRKWLLWSVVPLAGLVVLLGSWAVFSRRIPQPAEPAVAKVEPEPEPAVAPDDSPPPGPDHFDFRWLPDGTAMLADLRVSEGMMKAQGRALLDGLAEWWQPAVAAPLRGLGFDPEAVRRLRVASSDLAAWPDRLILLVQLHEGHDATRLAARGEAVPIALGGATCRRLTDGWTQPFAVLNERTILTGDEALLNELAGRGEPQFHSEWIRNMLADRPSLAPANARLAIDLNAARAAGWNLPAAALDVWPEASRAWRALLGVPAGLHAVLQWPDRLRSELTFACESETSAEEVRKALEALVPLLRQAVAGRAEELAALEEDATDASANGYAAFLAGAATVLQSAQWNVDGRDVQIDVDWGAGPWTLAAATLAAQPSLRADWLDAALTADTERQRRIVSGLIDYRQAEGEWPPGVAGSALLPPETRLSWIAELLPYLGHADWHRSLRSGYAWNSPQNRPVTRRQLDSFVNPALGPSRTGAGYPVTHYVGITGVGPDAATLPADHPRAGVFGFGRRTRREDIGDGASNVIAILGVTDDLGAWAAGGHPTVRSLTTPPYVNGPDGFGSGQRDGMLAGMADGSVRFISKDIDTDVIEVLATINSGSAMTVAALDDPAGPPPDSIEPRPEVAEPAVPEKPQPAVAEAEAVADEPAREPLPAVDVTARLTESVPQLEMTDVPLGQVVGLLAQIGGVPITFDPDGIASVGVSLRDPVALRRDEANLGKLLEAVLAERGLTYVTERGQVLVTAPAVARGELTSRRYRVDDLAADQTSLAELAAVVQRLIAPESWQSEGGPGTVHARDGALVIEQTASTHHQVLLFCEKLRRARGLPIRSRFPLEWFKLATRRTRAADVLAEEITANFREPTPLVEVLGHLGGLAGADILVDRRPMAAAGISDTDPASVAIVDEPFDATLDKLLRPLGLAWRALDARTLQVSTQAALDETMELEFYPVAPLLDGLVTGETLVEQVRNRIAGPTWSDAGGPGAIHYDPKGRCLIVRHNQTVQAAIERLLGQQAVAGGR